MEAEQNRLRRLLGGGVDSATLQNAIQSTTAGRPARSSRSQAPPFVQTQAQGSQNSHGQPTRSSSGFNLQSSGPHPIADNDDPVPIYTPLSHAQARMTTYSSRIKLGLTSLMQPLSQAYAEKRPLENKAPQYGTGKRARTQINYAEMGALEDDDVPESDGEQSDASGFAAPPVAPPPRRPGRPPKSSYVDTPKPTPPPQVPEQPKIFYKSYLGAVPPAKLIIVEPAKRTRHVYPSIETLEERAKLKSHPVPIKIELDTETHKIRDCFVWDSSDHTITPDLFALTFCEDVGIPVKTYKDKIAHMIAEQIKEQSTTSEIPILAEEPEEYVDADIRVIVNLDIQIQNLHIVDKIEWDLSSPLTPELFALQLCAELGLTGEAAPIISHAIHDELLRHKKECIDIGLIGRAEHDRAIARGAKKLEGVFRDWSDTHDFGPRVEELTAEELERIDAEKERASKRKRAAAAANKPRRRGQFF